jgi:hypothetical protein
MNKNIIIAGLIACVLILMAALAFVLLNWQPPSRFTFSAKGPNAIAPAEDLREHPAKEEFTFKTGDHLNFKVAPSIIGRALTISAIFDSQDQNGVIVAQGGLAQGYSLYLQAGELMFALRRNNVLTTVSAGNIGAGRHSVIATLTGSGDLGINVDGQPKGSANAGGTITSYPSDGLDVGADRGAPVGPYRTPNIFGGTIESVKLTTAL